MASLIFIVFSDLAGQFLAGVSIPVTKNTKSSGTFMDRLICSLSNIILQAELAQV